MSEDEDYEIDSFDDLEITSRRKPGYDEDIDEDVEDVDDGDDGSSDSIPPVDQEEQDHDTSEASAEHPESTNSKQSKDPSVVPKHGQFFMHDDRSRKRKNVKGRGRRGRGIRREPEWRHDKFVENNVSSSDNQSRHNNNYRGRRGNRGRGGNRKRRYENSNSLNSNSQSNQTQSSITSSVNSVETTLEEQTTIHSISANEQSTDKSQVFRAKKNEKQETESLRSSPSFHHSKSDSIKDSTIQSRQTSNNKDQIGRNRFTAVQKRGSKYQKSTRSPHRNSSPNVVPKKPPNTKSQLLTREISDQTISSDKKPQKLQESAQSSSKYKPTPRVVRYSQLSSGSTIESKPKESTVQHPTFTYAPVPPVISYPQNVYYPDPSMYFNTTTYFDESGQPFYMIGGTYFPADLYQQQMMSYIDPTSYGYAPTISVQNPSSWNTPSTRSQSNEESEETQ